MSVETKRLRGSGDSSKARLDAAATAASEAYRISISGVLFIDAWSPMLHQKHMAYIGQNDLLAA